MTSARLVALGIAAFAIVATTPTLAGERHHRHRPARPPASEAYQDYSGNWQAEAIARATDQMQNAPGVTNELAPDAKATATGGPSGGVPGFSGH